MALDRLLKSRGRGWYCGRAEELFIQQYQRLGRNERLRLSNDGSFVRVGRVENPRGHEKGTSCQLASFVGFGSEDRCA